MIRRIDAPEAKELMGRGAIVLDALPVETWRQEHLPGARSLPLQHFEPAQVADLDLTADLVVYCFDQHCDLSARLSRRLDELGFIAVHDLIGGRAAWTALGLPTEGTVGDARRISRYVERPDTVALDGTIGDLCELAESELPTPVVTNDGVLMGALQAPARGLAPSTPVADVMVPAPGTIRPELRIEEVVERLDRDGLGHVFVTSVDGRLIGLAVRAHLHV